MDFTNIKKINIPEGEVKSLSINNIKVWEKKGVLPSDYQEVEYIASDAYQPANAFYVNTEIKYTSDMKIELDMKFNNVNQNWCKLYGARTSDYVYILAECQNPRIYAPALKYNNETKELRSGSSVWKLGNRIKFIQNKNDFYIDDVLLTSFTYSYNESNVDLYIFNADNGTLSDRCCIMTVYGLKIYDGDGILISNCIPCYNKTTNVIGLYDVVRNKFLINGGTRTFSKGPDV